MIRVKITKDMRDLLSQSKIKIVLIASFLLFVSVLFAQRNTNESKVVTRLFKSHVSIPKSAIITVTEHILIEVKDEPYKGRITRHFDRIGQDRSCGRINVISLKKNFKIEPYTFTENEKGCKIIEFGTEELLPGVYDYVFQYQIESQISFINDFGQLNWDVTGFHWDFPIDSMVCVVKNPLSWVPDFYRAFRHQRSGMRGALHEQNQIKDGEIIEPLSASAKEVVYHSTRGFSPNERVRITVNIPRGYFPDYKQVYENSSYHERIKLFKSEIWIEPSGKMRVSENIFVNVQGYILKRGIVRNFPTTYKNKSGGIAKVPFDVISVTKNNKPEPYHIRSISNGKAIYVGEENVILPHGDYDYKIKYETHGQLGFFDDHDELYWNVNGNDWELDFDSIVCIVHMPKGATIKNYTAYSGHYGDKEKDFEIEVIDKQTIAFSSTKRYIKGEGLSIVVGWPKGFVEEPSFISQIWREYNVYVFVVFGVFFIGLFYYFIWKKIGVDPPQDVIYPLFYPPNDLSPSVLGYISTYGKDNNLLTSEIINLASKKALTIRELSKEYEIFMLIKNEPKDLTKFEQKLFDKLFEEGDELLLDKKNREIFQAAENIIEKQCENQNRNNKLFSLNFGFSFLGNVLTLFLFIIGWVFCFWNFWFIGVIIPLIIFYVFLATVPKTDPSWKFILSFFLIVGFYVVGSINSESTLIFAMFCVYLVGINALFFHLLKAPTVAGQKLMSKIKGFKMYLSIAEEDRLRHLHPPDVTQEVFERYLSYALALGVENEWAEKFEQYITAAGMDVDRISVNWYKGSSLTRFNASSFSSSLSSSFSSATSSSSSTPGSSSGFSSGGSSGGGGGGGGGGGW